MSPMGARLLPSGIRARAASEEKHPRDPALRKCTRKRAGLSPIRAGPVLDQMQAQEFPGLLVTETGAAEFLLSSISSHCSRC